MGGKVVPHMGHIILQGVQTLQFFSAIASGLATLSLRILVSSKFLGFVVVQDRAWALARHSHPLAPIHYYTEI